MTTKIKQLKAELKQLVIDIRQSKIIYKDQKPDAIPYSTWAKERGLVYKSSHGYEYALYPGDLSKKFRHMHIAYCLLRGRKYEQIENKVHEGNEPSWTQIESILANYREVEEIACAEVVNV